MCGINGILYFDGNVKHSSVENMNQALKHRGPDNLAVWYDAKIALGHARLSIIDLSNAANQPFVSTCGNFAIVFNGEIYNYKDIRHKLTTEFNCTLRTQSDTEVILEAYRLVGETCLEWLNGMFAFAIWNKQKETLFIARDRMGEKPLYYANHNKQFVFSSEIRALLASNILPRKLNLDVLNDFILFQTVYAPKTLVEGVSMLEAGCCLTVFNTGEVKKRVYWNMPEQKSSDNATQTLEKVRHLFERSIALRMVADVEVGAFLSGGIDSSAVVAQMSRLSKKPIYTFSVIFGETDFSEEEYSNLIAKKYNTNHHPIHIHANDFLHDIPSILRAVDFPGGDGPNTYVVAKATRATGIKVALTGLGGDELFAGYPIFKQASQFRGKKIVRNTPLFARKAAAALVRKLKKGTAGDKLGRILAAKKIDDATFYAFSRQLFDQHFASQLLSRTNANNENTVHAISRAIFSKSEHNYFLSAISKAEMQTYMQHVLLRDSDQMTMAHALEVRAPFLDHTLVEYVLGVSDALKYPHTPKQLFVNAMGDLLPTEVVNRKKMGFVFPWAKWLRNEMKPFCAERITTLAQRNCFNQKQLLGLWDKFVQNDPTVPWTRIWHLVTLEEWIRNNNIEA